LWNTHILNKLLIREIFFLKFKVIIFLWFGFERIIFLNNIIQFYWKISTFSFFFFYFPFSLLRVFFDAINLFEGNKTNPIVFFEISPIFWEDLDLAIRKNRVGICFKIKHQFFIAVSILSPAFLATHPSIHPSTHPARFLAETVLYTTFFFRRL
jgi:hypothetical protein